jgi:thioesterase domain-containing protein
LYRQLAKHLGKHQPFFALQSSGLNGKEPLLRTIEQMASRYIEEIKRVQPEGPYYLGGASLGGVIVFEMARQLSAAGQEIGLLVAFDSSVTRWTILKPKSRKPVRFIRRFAGHVRNFIRGGERRNLALTKWKKWKTRTSHKLYRFLLSLQKQTGIPFPKRIDTVKQANFYAYWNYVPQFYPGKLTLFRSTDNRQKNPDNGWEHFCDEVEIIKVEGRHSTLLHEPYVRRVAQALAICMEKAGNKN